MQADGTFNINVIKMPLIDMIGVTNTGETFPFAFCFVTSERGDAWRFTLQCLEECVFTDLPLPRVVIADQGLGLRSVFSDVWPTAILQFCEWHAAQNIKKRLAEKKYSKKDRDGIMDLVWAYIWSATEEALDHNRAEMMARMREGECEYIRKNWTPKEGQVIRFWTQQFPNLNCFSTQRDESVHPIVKPVLNPQIRLDEAVQRLKGEMTRVINRLIESEIQDEMNFPRVLDKRAFYFLRKSVASWPLKKVSAEWDDLVSIISGGQELGPCTCGMIERLGLPCRHTLERFFHDEIPIPLTFTHPRWWYDGPIESRANWRPHCGNMPSTKDGEEKLPRERPVHDITQSTNELLAFKETLDSEQQEKLAAAHLLATKQLLEDAQHQQAFKSSLPQLLPPPIPSTFNRKAKSHDKATKRSMLGVEIAIQEADRLEKEARAKNDAPVVDDDDTTFAPRTPSRKRTTTLVDRTPEKPREAPSTRLGIPPAPILVASAAVIAASVSTEPARPATTVTQSRSGRRVKKRDYRSVNSEGI